MPSQHLVVRCKCALSRPLYPSRGHFQSSLAGIRWRARHLPLEKLCPRWQARSDEARDLRVLAPLLPTNFLDLQACLGKSVQETLLGGVYLPDLLQRRLKSGCPATADGEVMQVD
jgi:hypothetical protein